MASPQEPRLKPQKQTMLLILGGHFKVAKTGHYCFEISLLSAHYMCYVKLCIAVR